MKAGSSFAGFNRGLVGGWDLHIGGLHAPDIPGVLADGSVAGELAGTRDVSNHCSCPLFRVLKRKQLGSSIKMSATNDCLLVLSSMITASTQTIVGLHDCNGCGNSATTWGIGNRSS